MLSVHRLRCRDKNAISVVAPTACATTRSSETCPAPCGCAGRRPYPFDRGAVWSCGLLRNTCSPLIGPWCFSTTLRDESASEWYWLGAIVTDEDVILAEDENRIAGILVCSTDIGALAAPCRPTYGAITKGDRSHMLLWTKRLSASERGTIQSCSGTRRSGTRSTPIT